MVVMFNTFDGDAYTCTTRFSLNKLADAREVPGIPAVNSLIANAGQTVAVGTLEAMQNRPYLGGEPVLDQPPVRASAACKRISCDADDW